MTNAKKYRISQLIMVVCLAGTVLSLSRMAPAGMSGDVHAVKFWFGALVFFLVVGSPAAITFYYYKSRRLDIDDQQQIAVKTLAKLGERQRKGKS